MKIIQRIQQNTGTLLAIAWLFSISGCRDFKDYRTPYKSFVEVAFTPIKKDDKLTITAITNTATRERKKIRSSVNKLIYTLSLDPNADSVQLDIYNSSTTFPEKLTILYQREAVLISHQCGCTYQYTIKKVMLSSKMKCKILNKKLSTFNDSDIDVQIYL